MTIIRHSRWIGLAICGTVMLAGCNPAIDPGLRPPTSLTVLSGGLTLTGIQQILSWVDNSSNEVGFRIERQSSPVPGTFPDPDIHSPVFVHVADVAADVTAFTDVAPLNAVMTYRVAAIATSGSLSGWSNLASVANPTNARWLDSFQSYPVGQFPTANWTRSGNASASGNEVIDDDSLSSGNALQLQGVYGGNWSAVAYRAVDLASWHTIFFKVRCSAWGGTGAHRCNAAIDLRVGPDWATRGRWLIFFGVDGKIRTSGKDVYNPLDYMDETTVLGDYVVGEWYEVEIGYARTANSTVVLHYNINGALAGSVEYPFIPEELDLAYVGLWSGDTTAWFDDVGVQPGILVP